MEPWSRPARHPPEPAGFGVPHHRRDQPSRPGHGSAVASRRHRGGRLQPVDDRNRDHRPAHRRPALAAAEHHPEDRDRPGRPAIDCAGHLWRRAGRGRLQDRGRAIPRRRRRLPIPAPPGRHGRAYLRRRGRVVLVGHGFVAEDARRPARSRQRHGQPIGPTGRRQRRHIGAVPAWSDGFAGRAELRQRERAGRPADGEPARQAARRRQQRGRQQHHQSDGRPGLAGGAEELRQGRDQPGSQDQGRDHQRRLAAGDGRRSGPPQHQGGSVPHRGAVWRSPGPQRLDGHRPEPRRVPRHEPRAARPGRHDRLLRRP